MENAKWVNFFIFFQLFFHLAFHFHFQSGKINVKLDIFCIWRPFGNSYMCEKKNFTHLRKFSNAKWVKTGYMGYDRGGRVWVCNGWLSTGYDTIGHQPGLHLRRMLLILRNRAAAVFFTFNTFLKVSRKKIECGAGAISTAQLRPWL